MSPSPLLSPDFDALLEMLKDMADRETLDGAMESVIQAMRARPHIIGAGLWLYDEEQELLRQYKLDLPPEVMNRLATRWSQLPVSTPYFGEVVRGGAPMRASHRSSDANLPGWAVENNLAAVSFNPLMRGQKALGVLVLFFHRMVTDDAWVTGRRIMRALSSQLAARVITEQALEELRDLHRQLEEENAYLRSEVKRIAFSDSIIGDSPGLRRVLEQVEMVASTEASVLILGETGTGKELIARAIHDASGRHKRPLISVNCAALQGALFESELFGHVKGAYTHAVADRKGRFEIADGGTIFLDEVSEITIDQQSKLLRVLQEGIFERVGESRSIQTDVRVIAATNRNLEAEVRAGRFRDDLYYRLSVFPIVLPPLRERREDIPELARHFVRKAAQRMGLHAPPLKQEHVQRLQQYDWPGNVRELQNVMERALILGNGRTLVLPSLIHSGGDDAGEPTAGTARILKESELRRLEERNLRAALEASGGRVQGEGGAAEMLGLAPSTLRSRLKSLGLDTPRRR
jgi:transcriptional regulator with GAF, ATPase, and Fis domain